MHGAACRSPRKHAEVSHDTVPAGVTSSRSRAPRGITAAARADGMFRLLPSPRGGRVVSVFGDFYRRNPGHERAPALAHELQ